MIDQNSNTFSVVLTRDDSHMPWGFRLQGGAELTIPLSIQQVSNGSLAERSGLLPNDTILAINQRSVEGLEHEAAKGLIIQSGDHVQFLIERGEMKIWKPKVTPISELQPSSVRHVPEFTDTCLIQKTSLAADKQAMREIGSGYNRTAKLFEGFGSSTAQVISSESSNNIYPNQSSSSQFNTAYCGTGRSDTRDTTIRSVKAPVFHPSAPEQIQKTQHMVCKPCGRLIIGVFVRIKGEPLHPECFRCFTCGKNLKNQGYYHVQDHMYCEAHAREATDY